MTNTKGFWGLPSVALPIIINRGGQLPDNELFYSEQLHIVDRRCLAREGIKTEIAPAPSGYYILVSFTLQYQLTTSRRDDDRSLCAGMSDNCETLKIPLRLLLAHPQTPTT